MKWLLMTAVFATAAHAQTDLAGRWSGTIAANGGAPQPLHAQFKVEGTNVTGGFGGDTAGFAKLVPISKVKVDGDRITFDVNWGDVVHIALKREGNELTGELHGDGPSPPPGKHAAVITIALKRSTPAP